MKKSNFLKIVMTLVMAFAFSGVFAQITITVNESTGSSANGAILYTIADGVATTVAVDGAGTDLDGTTNGVIQINPAAGTYNYVISNAGPTQWNTYGINYDGTGPVTATVTLNANFTETIQDYVAGYTGDKITVNMDMPLWVYPSPVHNPGWTAPAAIYATEADITTGLSSSFTWGLDAGTDVSGTANDNYVEVSWAGTGVKTITVRETADAAYGSCLGNIQTFFLTVINPPYAKINETTSNVLGLTNVIANGCSPQNTNIDVLFDNASEEFPYHLVPTVTAYNYDLNGAGDALINPAVVGVPAALQLAGVADNTPISMAAAGELIAAKDYVTVNDKITVYEIDLAKWNAKISRKSDYVTIRDGSSDNTRPDSYSYYTAATSGQPAADVTVARIIVFPAPVTGPIYHIPNTWGL